MDTKTTTGLTSIDDLIEICMKKQKERIKTDPEYAKKCASTNKDADTCDGSMEQKTEGNIPVKTDTSIASYPDDIKSQKNPASSGFFLASIMNATPKNDLASMGHPMFALKPGEKTIRKYESNGNTLEIRPGTLGMATLHDKDILVYCISQVMAALNNQCQGVGRTLRFKAHDLLRYLGRPVSGQGYLDLRAAFDRLDGIRVKTNISTGGLRVSSWFGMVESINIIEQKDKGGRMGMVEITLSEWIYRAAISREVLTINRDYFRIRSPFQRRLYEIVRKHCGKRKEWTIGVSNLFLKTGSKCTAGEFRRMLKEVEKKQCLLDYNIHLTTIGNKLSISSQNAVFSPKQS